MVRRKVNVNAWARVACALVVIGSSAGLVLVEGQTPSAAARALDSLLEKATASAAGPYTITGTTATAGTEKAPMFLQADVFRGPEKSVRAAIVVGADVPRASEVRLRVMSVVPAGQTPRVIGTANGPAPAGHARFVHEFTLAPGEYEMQAVVGDDRAGTVSATLAKSRFSVPDVWGASMIVSPIVLGDEATVGPRGTTKPFTFGPTTLSPAVTDQFPQSGSVRAAFRIFNWTAKDGEKPDLTVDYRFYAQGTKRLNLFNQTKPQQLNAATLGEAFNAAAGVVTSGMHFPLGSFTFGEFQLKVTVTDNRNKQTAERTTKFFVVP
jgi:hypothetical protein